MEDAKNFVHHHIGICGHDRAHGLRADDIAYTVNQSLPSGSITGTITTDGTLGTLGTADIVGWNLTSTEGASSLILTPSDSQVLFGGNDLTATPTALTLDFSNVNYGYLDFAATSPSVGYAVWVAGYVPGAYGYIAANAIDNSPPDETYEFVSGSQEIATATPEPSSLLLLSSGLVGLGFMKRKVFQS